MRWHKTLCKYFRTFFVPDVVILAAEWTVNMAILTRQMRGYNGLGLERVVRLVRVIRVARLFRLKRHSAEITLPSFLLKSQMFVSLIQISKMMAIVLLMNHYVACGWVYLGRSTDTSWLTDRSASNMSVYAIALHWSLTQFTPAAMDVVATNHSERIYSICTIVFAFMTFSYFVSSITRIMQIMGKMQSAREIQGHALQRYFIDNDISADLGARISRFIMENHFSQRVRSMERDTKLLEHIPKFLKDELHEELHAPVAVRMPFFKTLQLVDPMALCFVCHSALQQVTYVGEENLFELGAPAEQVFFFVGGFADYVHKKDIAAIENNAVRISRMSQSLKSPDWVGDPVMWLRWTHQGHLIAKTLLDCTTLTVEAFHRVLTQVRPSWLYAQAYAKLFQAYITKSHWDTDLWCSARILKDLAIVAQSTNADPFVGKTSVAS